MYWKVSIWLYRCDRNWVGGCAVKRWVNDEVNVVNFQAIIEIILKVIMLINS